MCEVSSIIGVQKGKGQGGNGADLVLDLEFGDSIYRVLQNFCLTKLSVYPLWLDLNECHKLAEDSQP